jgi:hypothetical protein
MDIIGIMHAPTGETNQDEDGNAVPVMAAVAGYHVNTPEPVESWAARRITPNSPSRVYAGHATCFYVFADEAEFTAMAIDAGLIEAQAEQTESEE